MPHFVTDVTVTDSDGADFSLNVADVTVMVTVRTFPNLEAVPTFQL